MGKIDKTPQHIRVPNSIGLSSVISPNDILVYAFLKSYMNSVTKKCYPTIDTLSKDTCLSKKTVSNCIKSLCDNNFISITKYKSNNVYSFNHECLKDFEPYSYEFLKSLDLPPRLKGFWIALQHFTFKDTNDGLARTTYTDLELSEKTKTPITSFRRYQKELIEKGILTKLIMKKRNEITGEKTILKTYNLKMLNQDMLFMKQQIENQNVKINRIDDKVLMLEKEINEVKQFKSIFKDVIDHIELDDLRDYIKAKKAQDVSFTESK